MLIDELVKYDKQFQVMIYPNRTHAIREGEGIPCIFPICSRLTWENIAPAAGLAQ